MIPSVAVTVGLLVQATAAQQAARHSRGPDPVRVWRAESLAYVALREPGHLLLLHVDPIGRINVLFPFGPYDGTEIDAGVAFAVPLPPTAHGTPATLVAVRSRWPFDFAVLEGDRRNLGLPRCLVAAADRGRPARSAPRHRRPCHRWASVRLRWGEICERRVRCSAGCAASAAGLPQLRAPRNGGCCRSPRCAGEHGGLLERIADEFVLRGGNGKRLDHERAATGAAPSPCSHADAGLRALLLADRGPPRTTALRGADPFSSSSRRS